MDSSESAARLQQRALQSAFVRHAFWLCAAAALVTTDCGGGSGGGAAPPPTGQGTLTVTPRIVALTTSQSTTFTASVSGSTNVAVSWSVDGVAGGNASSGTIDSSGRYTPSSAAGSHTIGATSQADPASSATAIAAVTDLDGIATYHGDVARSGHNAQEYALTPARVATPGAFGKIFSCAVDGQVYAQPLYVANLAIAGAQRNVVFVATEHDSVYAFDADAAGCTPYWKTSFLGPGVTPVAAADTGEAGDLTPEIGITGTPVIDLARAALYVVAKTQENGAYVQRLHALDLTSGAEKFGGPVAIQATSAGSGVGGNTFDALRENQRSALLLHDGVVYIAWASHGDIPPYHGWIIGYDAGTLRRATVFNVTPNGEAGGIWMAGGGPAADGAGNIYVVTGNGTFDGNTTVPPLAPSDNFSESFLRLATAGGLSVGDFFTPTNQDLLNANDWDLGSGAPVVLPDSMGSAAHPHLLVAGDKQGYLYLVDRDHMGRYNGSGADANVQTVHVLASAPCVPCGFFDTPAVLADRIYVAANNDTLRAFRIANATMTAAGSASDLALGVSGATPVVSSLAGASGLVWIVDASANGTNGADQGPAVLRAYDAANLGTALYRSDANPADQAGDAVKFVPPVVANGKVYVAGRASFTVYGLAP